jgi:hypothetical protein
MSDVVFLRTLIQEDRERCQMQGQATTVGGANFRKSGLRLKSNKQFPVESSPSGKSTTSKPDTQVPPMPFQASQPVAPYTQAYGISKPD